MYIDKFKNPIMNFNIGDLVIDGVEYSSKEIKNLSLKYVKVISQSKAKYFVLYDNKSFRTLSFIIATILCRKTFVIIPKSMDLKNKNNIMKELNVDLIHTEDSLEELVKDDFIPPIQPIDIIFKSWNNNDENFISYIMYTSGTTGTPKGVVMSFYAAYNTFLGMRDLFNINSSDTVLNLARWSFDLSIFDIFCNIFLGIKMVCIEDSKNVQVINDAVNKHEVSIWNSTPQVIDMYARYLDLFKKNNNNKIRLILLSGDKFEKNTYKIVNSNFSSSRIISLGGATECAIWSIYYECTGGFSGNIAPYGYALPGQTVEVIYDESGIGEIVISGEGLAEGYYNNKIKTEEQFRVDSEGLRKYYTGDIGFVDDSGCIFIEGRRDSQVKINGKRYKLNEIAKMFYVEGFRNPACVVDKDKTKLYVFIQSGSLNKNKINKIVNETLLKEVINTRDVIELDDFPITNNGKLDINVIKEMAIGK